jgi:two-component sensor histidine kinase
MGFSSSSGNCSATIFWSSICIQLLLFHNNPNNVYLVSNSLKHAFPGRDKGEIRIKLRRGEKAECKSEGCKSTNFVLSVSDNGIGMPNDLNIEDLDSLGLQLVTTLVDQLDGVLQLKRNNGTEFTIRFSVIEKENQSSAPAL